MRAAAARRDPAEHHPVADGDPRHSLADLDHVAGPLVAGDERRGLGQDAAHRRQVGVAEAGGPQPDPHLARSEADRLDVVADVERVLTGPVQDGGAHGLLPGPSRIRGSSVGPILARRARTE